MCNEHADKQSTVVEVGGASADDAAGHLNVWHVRHHLSLLERGFQEERVPGDGVRPGCGWQCDLCQCCRELPASLWLWLAV
jgi:hypothetical protein